jgi:hypothetical protein
MDKREKNRNFLCVSSVFLCASVVKFRILRTELNIAHLAQAG